MTGASPRAVAVAAAAVVLLAAGARALAVGTGTGCAATSSCTGRAVLGAALTTTGLLLGSNAARGRPSLGLVAVFGGIGAGSLLTWAAGGGIAALVTGLVLLVAPPAAAGWLRYAERAERDRIERLMATGRELPATVVEVKDTGVRRDGVPRVRLGLRITPPDAAPYVSTRVETLPAVQTPRLNDECRVWVNPADPDDWTYALSGPGAPPVPAEVPPPPENVVHELRALNEARRAGRLSAAEFAARGDELMSR